MVDTAIQLYTVRDMDESVPEILELVADAGYDGVEFAYRVADADTEAVVEALDSTGLAVPSAHVGLDGLEDGLSDTAALHGALGTDRLVLSYLDAAHFASEGAAADTAALLGDLAEVAGSRGFGFGYHNHEHEFVDVNGATGYEAVVADAPGAVGFQLDVGWAAAGGSDPAALLDRYGDRFVSLHVTDVDADGEGVAVGTGVVDHAACAAAARDAGIDWFVFEDDDPEDPRAAIGTGAEFLADL